MPRRKLWMAPTNTTCKRRIIILHLHLPAHRTKYILWIIQLHTHMIRRSSNPILNHSNSIYRICITMGTNIILRSNCNYKPIISNPLHRKRNCTMSMRRLCSRQCNSYTILRITLPNTICNYSNSNNSSTIPTPNRIK